MRRILSFFRDPIWNFLWGLLIALGYFGIKSEDIMNFPWTEALKLSFVLGVSLFVIHAYYSLKLQVKRIDKKTNDTIDLLPGLHKRLWVRLFCDDPEKY